MTGKDLCGCFKKKNDVADSRNRGSLCGRPYDNCDRERLCTGTGGD